MGLAFPECSCIGETDKVHVFCWTEIESKGMILWPVGLDVPEKDTRIQMIRLELLIQTET
jgi:hypothetical protein